MSWFKIDDGFYDHPKVQQLPNAAVGLWVKAGAWSARHETDGVVPAAIIRSFKGTAAQVSALVSSGLWDQIETDSGSKAYSFRDWFDYQPSHESREEERALWREKKRKSRAQKLDNLRKSLNVPRGVPEMSPEGTTEGVPEMSGTIPVPSRPLVDQAGSNGEVVGERAHSAAADFSLDGLAAIAAAARDAGVSEDAITAGTRRFTAREGPKGPGLLRILIGEAWQNEQDETAKQQVIAQKREEIAQCIVCDEDGWIMTPDGLLRCEHDTIAPF